MVARGETGGWLPTTQSASGSGASGSGALGSWVSSVMPTSFWFRRALPLGVVCVCVALWGAAIPGGMWAGGHIVELDTMPAVLVPLKFVRGSAQEAGAAWLAADSAFGKAVAVAFKDSKLDQAGNPRSNAPRRAIDVTSMAWKGWRSLFFRGGGMDGTDRVLLQDVYLQADSVFEFGLGESSRLAVATRVPRFSGTDSDAMYVGSVRAASPLHYRFSFADIGPTVEWGYPAEWTGKRVLTYELGPLATELEPFDVYLIDGRFRVACVAVSVLHAAAGGRTDSIFLLHDYADRENRYGEVLKITDKVAQADGGRLIVLRRKAGVSDDDIIALWEIHRHDPF